MLRAFFGLDFPSGVSDRASTGLFLPSAGTSPESVEGRALLGSTEGRALLCSVVVRL